MMLPTEVTHRQARQVTHRRQGSHIAMVLGLLEKYAGQNLSADEMAAILGITARQARVAVNNLRNTDRDGAATRIVTVVRGHLWRWQPDRPEPPAETTTGSNGNGGRSRRLFEELAVTKSGDVIAQDEDGGLYRLVEL